MVILLKPLTLKLSLAKPITSEVSISYTYKNPMYLSKREDIWGGGEGREVAT